MTGEAPKVRRDVNLLAPSQNPQAPRTLLGPTIQQPNPWLDTFRKLGVDQQKARDRDLMRVFRATADAHPDLAAEAERKGIDLGLSPQTAEADMEKARKLWDEWEFAARVRAGGSELHLRMLIDPQFARIARDDLDNLSAAEHVIKQWTAGDLGREASRIRYKQSQNFGILSDEDQARLDEIADEQMGLPQDSGGHGLLSLVYGGARMVGGMWDTALWSAGAAGGGFLLAGPPGAAFAGLSMLGIASGEQIGGEAYGEMRRLGISHENAKGRAEWAAFAGGLLEAGALRLGGLAVASSAVKNYVARKAAAGMLTRKTKAQIAGAVATGWVRSAMPEVGVEVAQEAISWGLTTGALKEENLPDDRGDFGAHMEHTFWETMRGVAILSSFGPALQFTNNLQKVQVAQQTEKQLLEFDKVVTESKVAKRSRGVPDKSNRFLEFLQQAVEESDGPKAFFFDLDVFSEMMDETGVTMTELAERAPEVAADVRRAEAEGLGVFELPTASYGAKFLSEDFGRALIPHARVEADGLTAAEGLEVEANAEAITEQGRKLLEDAERTTEEFKAEVTKVRKQRYAQIVAAGQPPRQASVMANLHSHKVAVLADRMDMAPAKVAKRYFGEVRAGEVGVTVEALEQPGEPVGFYSAASRQIEALPTKASTPAGWKQALTGLVKKGKVKQDEVFWSGLAEWLDLQEGKVTKEQVAEFLRENGVRVEPVELGEVGGEIKTLTDELGDVMTEIDHTIGRRQMAFAQGPEMFKAVEQELDEKDQELRDRRNQIQDRIIELEAKARPKFGEYTLPGGKNYREVLLTLPERFGAPKRDPKDVARLAELDTQLDDINEQIESLSYSQDEQVLAERSERMAERTTLQDEWREIARRLEDPRVGAFDSAQGFRSPHFDQPNVVAHLRLNDRVGPDGEKVLFVEEIQSDWAQAGRKKGFAAVVTAEERTQADALRERARTSDDSSQFTDADRELLARVDNLGQGIPRAPFVSTEQTASLRVIKEKQETTDPKTGKTSERAVPVSYDVYYGIDKQGKAVKVGSFGSRKTAEEDIERLNARKEIVENVKGWLNLALKHLVLIGVNEGYDQVAFINGEQTADRYDLSKKIERIKVHPVERDDIVEVTLVELDRDEEHVLQVGASTGVVEVATLDGVKGKQLEDVVGKEMSKKIMGQEKPAPITELPEGYEVRKNEGYVIEDREVSDSYVVVEARSNKRGRKIIGVHGERYTTEAEAIAGALKQLNYDASTTIEGEDLKVGGEWALNLYDSIIPKAVKKLFGKKGEVGVVDYETTLTSLPKDWSVREVAGKGFYVIDAHGHQQNITPYRTREGAIAETLRGINETRPVEQRESRIGDQFTLTITDKLRTDVEAEGLPLFAQRGRFIPSTRETILTEGADASTVMHEMLHEYVNALLVIANEGEAPQTIVEDVDTLMRFFKMEGETAADRLAAWNALSFAEQAPHQEAVSYNYELWLFNGTAPTVGLRRLFERIRDFMIGVYTSLVEAQRKLTGRYEENFGRDLPGITPELREMFERMVAGEQAAQKLEAVREQGPLFETEEEFRALGTTAEDWARYQQMDRDRREQLKTDLIAGSVRAMQYQGRATGRVLKELQQKRAKLRREVREEVAEQVRQEPVHQIREAFTPQQIAAAPDDIAAFFPEDFPTGKILQAALYATPSLEEAIEQRTAQEMQRRYGDELSEEAIQEQVEAAVHSEARAWFVAAEWNYLEGSLRPIRVMRAATRGAARRLLDRRALNDMSVHTFARLEDGAGAAARRAMKVIQPRAAYTDKNGVKHEAIEGREPDLEAAIDAKHRQLLNNQLTKQAVKAKEEIRKVKDGLFRRVSRGSNEELKKTRDVNRAHVARALLSLYGLIPESVAARTADHLATMREHQPEVFAQFEELLAAHQVAGAAVEYNHQRMTLADFRVLRETVESLWFHSRRVKQMEVEGKQRDLDDIYKELEPGFKKHARKETPGQTSAVPKGIGQTIKTSILSGLAAMTKVEHYNRWLDGGVIGPFTRYLFLNLKEAVNKYRAAAVKHTKRLVEMMEQARADGLFDGIEIEAPELGRHDDGTPFYTFGKDGRSPAMVELIGALLHVRGNESNRSKFLVAGRGEPWADVIFDKDGKEVAIDYSRWDAFEARLVATGVLRKEHYDLVQSVFDLLEEIKPVLQSTHVKLEGYAFKEVKAMPFVIAFPDGTEQTYKGGYIPASVDYDAARLIPGTQIGPREVNEAQMRKEYVEGLPRVGAGMTKERVEGYRKRPLTMDLGHIVAHIDQSLRYAYVGPAAADMGRLLMHDEFQTAMDKVDPNAIEDLYKPLLDRAVTQSLYIEADSPGGRAVGNFFKHFRRMVGIKIMAGNVSVGLQQYTGISNALLYMKARHVKGGIMTLLRRRMDLVNEIVRLSSFMDHRLRNQMFQLAEEMRNTTLNQTSLEKLQSQWISWGYILQATTQNMVDIAVWKGGFDQAMENATPDETVFAMEKRAVEEADQAVRLSQGSFSPEDVPAYEKNSPFVKTWFQFTSYFNTVMNQVRFAKEGDRTKAAIFGFAIPMLVAQAIAMQLYDLWEDEDDDGHIDAASFRELFLWSQVRGAAAVIPGFGNNVVNIFDQIYGTRPYGDRTVVAPTISTLMESAIGMGKALDDLREGNPPTTRNVRDALSLAVVMVPQGGAALAPFIRPISYGLGIARGETEPTSPADAVRGFLSGRASEESRRR